jgi:flagellar assembly protein FliH
MKNDGEFNPSVWSPGELTAPRTEKNPAKWEPAVRYATAANATDVATQIIVDARRQADEIIRQSEATAKNIQEQAYQDGWNASLGELRNHFETAKNLIQETSDWREELLSQSESMILTLVKDISQKLFGEGYVLDKDTLQQTFNRVLENARSLGNLRIYVNPEDAGLLGPYWRELQESITSHKIEVVPSSSISRGGCYVNGQWGSADGRIETQLKAIIDTLEPEESNPNGENPE